MSIQNVLSLRSNVCLRGFMLFDLSALLCFVFFIENNIAVNKDFLHALQNHARQTDGIFTNSLFLRIKKRNFLGNDNAALFSVSLKYLNNT